MALTSLVPIRSHMHPGPRLPEQVMLNDELFDTVHEARVIGEGWRQHYDTHNRIAL